MPHLPVAAAGPLALLLWALPACDAPAPLDLGWRFADGRTCEDSGAPQVRLAGPIACDMACLFPCSAGVGATVRLTFHGDGLVTATALTPEGAPLYRGTLDAHTASPATLTLYYTGGR